MKEQSTADCTECEFRTTDGCGPGSVMMCGHEYFKDYHGYEAAIIQWVGPFENRRAVSYKCPLKNMTNTGKGNED